MKKTFYFTTLLLMLAFMVSCQSQRTKKELCSKRVATWVNSSSGTLTYMFFGYSGDYRGLQVGSLTGYQMLEESGHWEVDGKNVILRWTSKSGEERSETMRLSDGILYAEDGTSYVKTEDE